MTLIQAISSVTPKRALALAAAFAACALGAAFVAQFGFSLHPCDLCIYQRYPYGLIALIGGFGYFRVVSVKMQRLLLLACALLFLTDAGIAFYHTGVEYGWFPGPTACSSDTKGGQTLEEMRAAILHAPLVTCAQAMAYIFGLSMAAWNAIAAFCASVATFIYLGKKQ